MATAKSLNRRIGKPRGSSQGKPGGKPRNITVAGGKPATSRSFPALSTAAYAFSIHDPLLLPPPGAPELAFSGRSNSGKSSAINTIVGRRRLAFASKTPGRTQLLNFFAVGAAAYLVDLPGYGYAGVPLEVRAHWEHLVGTYIAERPSLAGVVVVMDSRHPLTELDLRLLDWLRASERSAHVLLTKADKLSRQAATATLQRVRRELAEGYPGTTVQLFSSLKREGVEEAAEALKRLAASHKNKAPAKGE